MNAIRRGKCLVGGTSQHLSDVDRASSYCTLPAVITDAQLLPREVAVAVVGAAAVVPAVGDVAGLAFPVLVTFTVHSAGG